MDQLYRPSKFLASDIIDFKEYFKEYTSLDKNLTEEPTETAELKQIKKILENYGCSLPLHQIRNMSSSCGVQHLTCQGENKNLPMKPPDAAARNFKVDFIHPVSSTSSNLRVTNLDTCRALPEQIEMSLNLRRGFLDSMKVDPEARNMKPGEEYLILVTFYKPKRFLKKAVKRYAGACFDRSLEVLGRTTFTEFRDAIQCNLDSVLLREVQSTKEDMTKFKDPKNLYPSGFFFIENVFYNDFRHPQSLDYSEVILEWAKEKGIGPMTTSTMENKTISSIPFRLGYPYVYMHQGECEHVMVFADAKLLQSNDDLSSASYPRLCGRSKWSNYQQCYLCGIQNALWICMECERLPQERTYLCTECTDRYLYVDGKKLGTFKLYPFFLGKEKRSAEGKKAASGGESCAEKIGIDGKEQDSINGSSSSSDGDGKNEVDSIVRLE